MARLCRRRVFVGAPPLQRRTAAQFGALFDGHARHPCSAAGTYGRVKDLFACEPRGRMQTKVLTAHEMYFATGLRDDLQGSSREESTAAFVRRYQIYFKKLPPPLPASWLASAVASEVAPPAV